MKRILILPLCILVLFAAGCAKKNTPNSTVTPGQNGSAATAKPSKVPTQAELRAELGQALQNFQNAKYYKADMKMTSKDNELNAALSVAKPNRFKGVIKNKETSMEIILVEKDMYLKVNNGNWAKLAPNSANKKTIENVKKSINGEGSLESMGIDDAKPITKYYRSDKACDVYETELKQPAGTYQAVKICIAKELPKIFEVKNQEGNLTINYYDINSVFLIERPMR